MKILLAEDSVFYRRIIAKHLNAWGFGFVEARDGKEAWKILMQQDGPKLALLDWILPEIEGIEICRRLRSRPEGAQYTYTILLTAKNQQEEMLEAMDAGADDFLSKPFDPAELKARLLAGQRIAELQEKLISTNEALHFAASHDFLTRVWNRGEVLAFLHREMVRSRRSATPVGVVLVDVDHFKQVNDKLGHQAGDCVLQELAKRFSGNLREYDGVGRYGGEEFLLVVPGCDLATTVRRANEIRTMIANEAIVHDSKPTKVTISMGVAVAEASETVESLLRRTDAALYLAKSNGRNRVETSITSLAASV
jgi:diguanylate cyclase (GGDEF)-like protein